MAGPEDPEDDTPYFYEYFNMPVWAGGDNFTGVGLFGFIPPSEDLSTFRRTQYITDMVASNKFEGTTAPVGRHFILNQNIDTGDGSTTSGNSAAWANGIDISNPQENPGGGWVINPQEHIPCRRYNAQTCSLAARARQMWQMNLIDDSISGDGWGSNYNSSTNGLDSLSGGFDLVNVGSIGELFESPVIASNNFGPETIGPFKMSDFYGTGHWTINTTIAESEIVYANAPAIQIMTIFSLGNPLFGGFGLRMKSSGQIHLGGNPTNPTGNATPNEDEGTTLVGENTGYTDDDFGVSFDEANISVTSTNIRDDDDDDDIVTTIINSHFGNVSGNILELLEIDLDDDEREPEGTDVDGLEVDDGVLEDPGEADDGRG